MLKKFDDDKAVAIAISNQIESLLQEKPDALICIAGGDTPLKTMAELVRRNKNGQIDFSKAYFVGLDEWVGLGHETKGSCRQTLYDYFYDQLENINPDHICFFDGKAKNLAVECKRIDHFIDERGGIDFILLGIGMNGHIGFNEPGVPVDVNAHVVELDDVTKKVMSKYFDQDLPLTNGISLGMKQIKQAKEIIVAATGSKKAEIVELTMNSEPTANIPATLLKNATSTQFFVDQEAGARV
ncbi:MULTISPECIES: glucosamine-6-phosphate deaminase [unclassified Listeria]|uniref:glucosamine-6-phosphate deaminase n=1 Tax=unclassified Listeria TaxID=2642072 RepID=UPI000B587B97|nr:MULTISPECIES: glucosamine-6-phosphate deaminase [unclassified Listeria]